MNRDEFYRRLFGLFLTRAVPYEEAADPYLEPPFSIQPIGTEDAWTLEICYPKRRPQRGPDDQWDLVSECVRFTLSPYDADLWGRAMDFGWMDLPDPNPSMETRMITVTQFVFQYAYEQLIVTFDGECAGTLSSGNYVGYFA